MALVTVQIQDMPDGSVDVRVFAEPHTSSLADLNPADFSPAQRLGATALNAIFAELQDGAAPQAHPKLVVVGADEMPL